MLLSSHFKYAVGLCCSGSYITSVMGGRSLLCNSSGVFSMFLALIKVFFFSYFLSTGVIFTGLSQRKQFKSPLRQKYI